MREKLPILLILGILIVLIAGCVNPLQQTAGGNATATDTFGSSLEALNAQIAAAKTEQEVASLSAIVASYSANATANPAYQKYLPLIETQSRALLLINASLLYADENSKIASSGIDCSRDYGSLSSLMESFNYTKQIALQKGNSYLSANPSSSVSSLISLINSTDTEGMYVFGILLPEVQEYSCPKTEKPSKSYTLPLSKDDAVSLVVAEVVGSSGYFVYYPGMELKSGDTVSVENPGGNITTRTMDADTWFFMLDDAPLATWSHAVKFVFVDAASGSYYATDEMNNPQINGIDYWYSFDTRLDKSWVVYPSNPDFNASLSASSLSQSTGGVLHYRFLGTIANVPAGTDCSKIDCCSGVGKKKALIVNGVDEDWFQQDADNMYKFLQGQMGYAKDDIYMLAPKTAGTDANEVTTMASFWGALSRLANDTQCCDKVFIYITGHGSNITYYIYKNKATGKKDVFTREDALGLDPAKYENTGYVYYHHRITINPPKTERLADGTNKTTGSPQGGRTYASNIAEQLNKIKSCYVTLLYDSCFAGAAAPWLAGRGRTVITTADTTSAYGSDNPLLGSQWNNNWMLGQTIFSDEADTNGDGTVSPQEAADYANKKTKERGLGQTGTYTTPKPPCVCCHVNCDASTNYLCNVVEGDGTNDPRCKKVGDGCTYTAFQNQTNQTTGNQTNRTQTGGGGTEGNTSISERCPGTNAPAECMNDTDCPKYRYCDTKSCTCKQYPQICGDGHIAAGESCDPKASPTGCYNDQVCTAGCVCQSAPAVCGDGKVSGNEQCDAGVSCSQSGYTCNMNTCQCEPSSAGNQSGGGTVNETYCGDGIVNGNEQCDGSAGYCSSGYHCSSCQCVQTPGYCGDGIINGNEQCDPKASQTGCYSPAVCSSGCTCVSPPVLNCPQICGYTSGAQSYQGTFTTAQQCKDYVANSVSPKTCYLTCIYAYLYTATNIAGSTSCCCGMTKDFACSNCPSAPGTQPYCPGQSTCDANAPSWYAG